MRDPLLTSVPLNTRARHFLVVVIALIALAAFIVAERLWAYDKPIQRDVSIYAVIGHEHLAGRPLYSDLLELRPPAVMLSFAGAEAIAGYGRPSVLLLYLLTAITTLLGVYYAASAGGIAGGLWAASFWAVLCGSYGLEAGEPNTEAFMNACLVWAFALWVRAGDARHRWRRTLIIGALFALASLYKHVAVVVPMLLAIVHVLLPPPGEHGRQRALADVAVIGGVGVGVWLLVSGYFAATGRFEIFREVMTGVSLDYAAADDVSFADERPGAVAVIARNIVAPLRGEAEFLVNMLNPLAVVAALGGMVGIFRNPRPWAFLLAFGLAAWIAIALPGQFYDHYYQLLLPPLIIGAGWTLGWLHAAAAGSALRWVAQVAGAVTLSLLIVSQLPFYRANAAGEWKGTTTDAESRAAEALAREIDGWLAPGETFYEWGGYPALYVYSGRSAPTGILMMNWFLHGRLADRLSERVIADLDRTKPELLVIAKKKWPENPDESAVSRWLIEHYDPLPAAYDRGPFALRVRRGGRLQARLQPARGTKFLLTAPSERLVAAIPAPRQ